MKNILEKIINDKKQSLELIKKDKSLDALEKNIKNQNFFNFKEAIQKNNGISIISEIKKASPSAGVLIDNFNHLEIAKMYVENGATCLSVLTEEKHFLGKLEYIQDIKKKFKIPILAKDFFIDPYQIALAKSYGCVEFRLPSAIPSVMSLIRRYEMFYLMLDFGINKDRINFTAFLNKCEPIILRMYDYNQDRADMILGLAKDFQHYINTGNRRQSIRPFIS